MSLSHEASTVRVAGMSLQELTENDKKCCVSMLFGMMRLQRARNKDTFPGANPVSIERSMIPKLREDYVAAAKTDGERFLMMAVTIRKVKVCVFVDRAMRFFIMPGQLPTMAFENSLLDGELVEYPDGAWNFLVFDCIYLSGLDIASHKFTTRLALVESWLLDIGEGLTGIKVAVKQFVPVGTGQIPDNVAPVDGVVFVPNRAPYVCFKNDNLFKWKADRQHTVDFKVEENRLCVLSKTKLVEKDRLHPDDKYKTGVIVECKYSSEGWRVVRPRPDKAHPNDLYVYSKTVLNIQEDIQRSELGV